MCFVKVILNFQQNFAVSNLNAKVLHRVHETKLFFARNKADAGRIKALFTRSVKFVYTERIFVFSSKFLSANNFQRTPKKQKRLAHKIFYATCKQDLNSRKMMSVICD